MHSCQLGMCRQGHSPCPNRRACNWTPDFIHHYRYARKHCKAGPLKAMWLVLYWSF